MQNKELCNPKKLDNSIKKTKIDIKITAESRRYRGSAAFYS